MSNLREIREIRELLGSDALLLPCKKGTKQPSIKWKNLTPRAMVKPDHLGRLRKAENIGVVLGIKSGGLCSIDIDKDEWVQPFLDKNPRLEATTQTKGKRGCNLWVRLKGDYPKTHNIKNRNETIGEFRAEGSQTIISGIHPSGCAYQFVRKTKPIELDYDCIVWPESWSAGGGTTPNTHHSSNYLNSKSSDLCSKSSILYNNNKTVPATHCDPVVNRIRARKLAVTALQRTHPNLTALYEVIIEPRFRAIVGARNAFLVKAVTFLYRAVGAQFILPLVGHFHTCNQAQFKDPLEQHLKEAQAMLEGVAETYLKELSENEREVYRALDERERNLFRICRDLALSGESEGKPIFYAPLTKFGQRLGLAGVQVQRDLKTLIGYGILEQVETGQQWQTGVKAQAGRYRYLLNAPKPLTVTPPEVTEAPGNKILSAS
ncbi:bifunctional DNA primase/polymerase [bacterium]|nr:bifunctional DNA primase/polymerase [bacterium]